MWRCVCAHARVRVWCTLPGLWHHGVGHAEEPQRWLQEHIFPGLRAGFLMAGQQRLAWQQPCWEDLKEKTEAGMF